MHLRGTAWTFELEPGAPHLTSGWEASNSLRYTVEDRILGVRSCRCILAAMKHLFEKVRRLICPSVLPCYQENLFFKCPFLSLYFSVCLPPSIFSLPLSLPYHSPFFCPLSPLVPCFPFHLAVYSVLRRWALLVKFSLWS